jgi:hypothetical protein
VVRLQLAGQSAQPVTSGLDSSLTERLLSMIERQHEQLQTTVPKAATDAVSRRSEQMEALQSCLQQMHAAQLLSEEAMYGLEDQIADCIEVMGSAATTDRDVDKVVRMIALSEGMAADGSFARQLRRKFG